MRERWPYALPLAGMRPDFSLVSNEYSTANHVFRGPRRSVLTPRAGPYHTANEFPPLLVKKQRWGRFKCLWSGSQKTSDDARRYQPSNLLDSQGSIHWCLAEIGPAHDRQSAANEAPARAAGPLPQPPHEATSSSYSIHRHQACRPASALAMLPCGARPTHKPAAAIPRVSWRR